MTSSDDDAAPFFAKELHCSLGARAHAAPAPLGARAQPCRRRLRPRTAGLAAILSERAGAAEPLRRPRAARAVVGHAATGPRGADVCQSGERGDMPYSPVKG